MAIHDILMPVSNFEGSEVRFGPQVGIGHQQKYRYRKKHRTSGIDVSSLVIRSGKDSDWIGFVIIYVLVWLNNNNICGFRGVFLAMPWDKLPKSASLLPLAIGLVTISVAVGTVGTCWNSHAEGKPKRRRSRGDDQLWLEALPWLEAKTCLFFGCVDCGIQTNSPYVFGMDQFGRNLVAVLL